MVGEETDAVNRFVESALEKNYDGLQSFTLTYYPTLKMWELHFDSDNVWFRIPIPPSGIQSYVDLMTELENETLPTTGGRTE